MRGKAAWIRALLSVVVVLALFDAPRPARADGRASLRVLGSSRPASGEAGARSLEWLARLTCDHAALAWRRRDADARGFLQVTPASRWLLAVGDLSLEWAAGGLRAAEGDFDRFARTGVGPAGRGLLRAAGTLSWSRAREPGVALVTPLGRGGLGAWAVGRARGAGLWVGPIAIACERVERATPMGISVVARFPGALLLEVSGQGGLRPAGRALAGRWRSPDRAGWGVLEGAFRLRSAAGPDTSGIEEGWNLRWSPPASARLRPTVDARTVRHGVNGAIPETVHRLGFTMTSAQALGTFGASVTGEVSERCRMHPAGAERRVLSRRRRLVTDLHGRVNLAPGLALALRYRQSGLQEDVGATESSSDPDGAEDAAAGEWDRGRGDALLGAIEWRSTRGIHAGLSLTAASGGETLPTWVPARRPLGATQWARLPAGGWIGEVWLGARCRFVRFEAVCSRRMSGVPGAASALTLHGGVELCAR